MHVIEKGVPIPPSSGGGRKPKYPWREMKVGDSFFVEGEPIKLRNSLYPLATRHNIKLTIRTEGNGVRVWRVE